MFEIVYYTTRRGDSPIKDFIGNLPLKLKLKVIRAIDYLEEHGNNIRPPYAAFLQDGIFELRVKFSSDIVRILFFFSENRIIVLTNSFVKKETKTPKEEIIRAINRRKDYLLQKGEENGKKK